MNPITEQRELLELAAKAAGIEGEWCDCTDCGEGGILTPNDFGKQWNPLTDDGDAFRLAVKLGLVLNLSPREDCRGQTVVTFNGLSKIGEPCYEGREQAARRAIVRAAAALTQGA